MKQILHTFRDHRSLALWSRYLRMITMIALLAFGSLGGWGETKSISLESINPIKGYDCTWTADTRTLSWPQTYNNYIELPNLSGNLSSYYNGNIIFSYSGLAEDAKFRVIISKKGNTNQDINYQYYISTTKNGSSSDVVIPVKDFVHVNEDQTTTKITVDDLKNVSRIALAGDAPANRSVSFGTTFTITTSSAAMAMSMKGFSHSGSDAGWDASKMELSWHTATNNRLRCGSPWIAHQAC